MNTPTLGIRGANGMVSTSSYFSNAINCLFFFLVLLRFILPAHSFTLTGMATLSVVYDRAKLWIERDPNPTTRAFLHHHLDNSNTTDTLQRLFSEDRRIAFGTAGLRATMEPGPMAMNDVTVLQAAQGIAKALKGPCVVVIGYDHREASQYNLSSKRFALLSALVFRQAGCCVILLDGYVATPFVPFTIQQQQQSVGQRAIGIMVTASHNRKEDAGYKVYWDDACQIRTPVDEEIAAQIERNLVPWIDYEEALNDLQKQYPDEPCFGLSDPLYTQEVTTAYYRALKESHLFSSKTTTSATQNRDRATPKICYSAMHGVGHRFVKRAFAELGLPTLVIVKEQQEPDPNFPTVVSPNPEEKGSLDLLQQVAIEHECEIALASDPDADRLAMMERNPDGKSWTTFTGDQVGALLGHWMWMKHKNVPNTVVSMCASTVSSKFLCAMADAEGFHFEESLAGFKWIGSSARRLHGAPVPGQPGKTYNSVFSYEESIGYCCGSVVFDKDGISATAVLAQLAIELYREGRTLRQHLKSLYDTYGEFVSQNGYFSVPTTDTIPHLLERLRGVTSVADYKVASSRFILQEEEESYDTAQPNGQPTLPCGAPMVTLRFENGCTAQFRPSGTEPKFKYYFEMQGKPGVPRLTLIAELEIMQMRVLDELFQKIFLCHRSGREATTHHHTSN